MSRRVLASRLLRIRFSEKRNRIPVLAMTRTPALTAMPTIAPVLSMWVDDGLRVIVAMAPPGGRGKAADSKVDSFLERLSGVSDAEQ